MLERRRFLAASAGALLSGCYTIHEAPPTELPAAGSRRVMLVGRIEVLPRVVGREQDIDVRTDLLNTKRYMLGRAVMQMADRPDPGQLHALGAQFLNPTLEQTYFFVVPHTERFMAKGSVTMEWRDLGGTSRSRLLETVELQFPAPLEIDIQPADRALYLGTLRVHRDTFHTVLGTEVLDQYAAARDEFRQRFGNEATLRKALLKLPGGAAPRLPRGRAA